MNVFYYKSFLKDLAKMDDSIRAAFKRRRDLLLKDPASVVLRVHKLAGEFEGCKSFNVTGDVRVVYAEIEGGYRFLRIGTHSELYG